MAASAKAICINAMAQGQEMQNVDDTNGNHNAATARFFSIGYNHRITNVVTFDEVPDIEK